MTSSNQTTDQWNRRITLLKEYITIEFPKGCQGVSCAVCPFGPDENEMCDHMWHCTNVMIARKHSRRSGRKINYRKKGE